MFPHENAKPYTKGVRAHRKWLKHLYGEGMRITYVDQRIEKGKQPLRSAYLVGYRNTPLKRLVPRRMAERLWENRKNR
jgi:hypothetical protein